MPIGSSVNFDLSGEYLAESAKSVKLVFSGPLVSPQTGFDCAAFGTPDVQNAALGVSPASLDAWVAGIHRLRHAEVNGGQVTANLTLTQPTPPGVNVAFTFGGPLVVNLNGRGRDWAEFGTASLANVAQGFFAQGIAPPAFPYPRVDLAEDYPNGGVVDFLFEVTDPTYTPPPTSVNFLFGLQIQILLISGNDFGAMGYPGVVNAAQGYSPLGEDFSKLGFPRVLDGSRFLDYAITVDFYGNYTPPSPVILEWGSGNQTIGPAGLDAAAFGSPELVNVAQGFFAEGLPAAEYGSPAVTPGAAPMRPTGSSFTSFGTPSLQKLLIQVYPTGSQFSAFGTLWATRGERYVEPAGTDHALFGAPAVANFNKELRLAGSSFTAFGTPVLLNNAIGVNPTGTDFAGIASPWLSAARRFMTPTGSSFGAMGSGPTVWHRNRTLYPVSLGDAARFGRLWAKGPDDAKLCNYAILLTF